MNLPKEIVVFGEHDEATLEQIKTCHEAFAVRSVLCADGHKGYSCPIGGVTSYTDSVSVSGVGYDIACGNMAVKTNVNWDDIRSGKKLLADTISEQVSFGIGGTSSVAQDHALFDDEAWKIPFLKTLKDKARKQLSSCGSGNHYCDIFTDQDQIVWVGVHFGSRGLGHGIASNTLLIAGSKNGMDAPPCILHECSTLGAEYLESIRLAGLYAYAGREIVVDHIVKNILKAKITDSVHNHHNFAWKENHENQNLWVIRKGATPAFPGQRGFVGGSMGDISVILKGIDSQKSRDSLYSTVHGAGRLMSRTEAAGKQKWIWNEKLKKKVPTRVTEGKINETSMRQKISNAGIELRGAGADESPEVYRPLQSVLDFHAGTIEIEKILNPKIVVMAASETYDPFKD